MSNASIFASMVARHTDVFTWTIHPSMFRDWLVALAGQPLDETTVVDVRARLMKMMVAPGVLFQPQIRATYAGCRPLSDRVVYSPKTEEFFRLKLLDITKITLVDQLCILYLSVESHGDTTWFALGPVFADDATIGELDNDVVIITQPGDPAAVLTWPDPVNWKVAPEHIQAEPDLMLGILKYQTAVVMLTVNAEESAYTVKTEGYLDPTTQIFQALRPAMNHFRSLCDVVLTRTSRSDVSLYMQQRASSIPDTLDQLKHCIAGDKSDPVSG